LSARAWISNLLRRAAGLLEPAYDDAELPQPMPPVRVEGRAAEMLAEGREPQINRPPAERQPLAGSIEERVRRARGR
jgi:hypothetical protein